MTSILWLLIWLLVMLIPISKKQGISKFHYIFSGILGFITAWIFVGGGMASTFLIWLLIGIKLVWQVIESSAMTLGGDDFNLGDLEKKFHTLVTFFGIIALIILLIAQGLWNFGMMRGVRSASYFDGLIKPGEGLPFNNEIPDDLLRMTTPELAKSIALSRMAEFGSGVQILSTHVTMYKNRLTWINTVASTNLWADNSIKGLVTVDANDPSKVEILKDITFAVGEGLLTIYPFTLGDAGARLYHGTSTDFNYGRQYMTQDPNGEWKLIVTSTYPRASDWVNEIHGVYVFNKMGALENYYEQGAIPSWIVQVYDEGWLEGMISNWGGFRRGDHDFDVWAAGLLWIKGPSNARIEMSEDTRFILDPDIGDVSAMVMVCPAGNARTLAGMFKATRDGIFYYDYREQGVISGDYAEEVIEKNIVARINGQVDATMPLLYPYKGRLTWFVPVYYKDLGADNKASEDDTLRLFELGIVDAVTEKCYVTKEEGCKTGAALVKLAKTGFDEVMSGITPQPKPTELEISGNITYISSVFDGTKHIITVNGTDVYFTVNSANVKYFDSLAIDQRVDWIVDINNRFLRVKS